MCSGDEVNGIIVRECLGDVCPEEETRPAWREAPASDIYDLKGGSAVGVQAPRLFAVGTRREIEETGDSPKKGICLPSGSDHSKSHIGPS